MKFSIPVRYMLYILIVFTMFSSYFKVIGKPLHLSYDTHADNGDEQFESIYSYSEPPVLNTTANAKEDLGSKFDKDDASSYYILKNNTYLLNNKQGFLALVYSRTLIKSLINDVKYYPENMAIDLLVTRTRNVLMAPENLDDELMIALRLLLASYGGGDPIELQKARLAHLIAVNNKPD